MEYSEAKRKEKDYVEKFLATKFFKAVGTCHCGGVKNYKYRNGNHTIYIRYKQGFFKIKKGNTTLLDLTTLDELEKYFQTAQIQTASH